MTAADVLVVVSLLADAIKAVTSGDAKKTMDAMDRAYEALTAIQRARLKQRTKPR